MIIHDSSHQRSNSEVCQKLQKCRRKCGSDSTLSLFLFVRKQVRTMRNISTKEAAEVTVDEYRRAKRYLQGIFFSIPYFLIIFGYFLFVKKKHGHIFVFWGREGKRRNVVLFPLKRGNKRHLQKLCVQVHVQHSVCTIFYNEIFNDSFILVPPILFQVLFWHNKIFWYFASVLYWIILLVFLRERKI